MHQQTPSTESKPSDPSRWVVGLGTYAIAIVFIAIVAIDWIWPWPTAVTMLDQSYPGNLRYCVSIESSPDRASRSYILLPASFKEVSVFRVSEDSGQAPVLRSTPWGKLVIFVYLHLVVFFAAAGRLAADVRAMASVPAKRPVAWTKSAARAVLERWKSPGHQPRKEWDARLLFVFVAAMVVLSLTGNFLNTASVVLLALLVMAVLVTISVLRKRNLVWTRTPVTRVRLVGLAVNLVIGAAWLSVLPPSLLTLEPVAVPWLLAFLSFFAYSALSCLGLTA